MTYRLTSIYSTTSSVSTTSQYFDQDFTLKVLSCSSFTIVDPSPWLKDKTANIAVPSTGATVYFPASSYPTFEVQPFTNNSFCVNSGACCSMTFTYGSVQTTNASGTVLTGIIASNIALMTLSDVNLPSLIGSSSQADLTVKITMYTSDINFQRSFTIHFINCAVASQANLSYLINRTTAMTYTLEQADAACTAIIKVRNSSLAVLSYSWLTINETSKSTLTINSDEIQLADSVANDYSVSRYVNLVNSATPYNRLDFKISLCKLTPPSNNGVDQASKVSFDNFASTGSVKLAAGSVSKLASCSGIVYSVSGLDTAWMTYNAATNSVDLDLTKS